MTGQDRPLDPDREASGKPKTAGDFARQMREFMQRVYPNEYVPTLLEPHQARIKRFEEIFRWLDEIYTHRERFNLHWALHEAGDVLERLIDESGRNIQECLSCHYRRENRQKLTDLTSRMDRRAHKKQAAINRKTQTFSILSFLVSLVDIVVSVILIILISEVAHIGNTLFDSIVLIILFTGIVAFLKVTLDRFVIIPLVTRWGWRRYLEDVSNIRQTLIEVEAVSIVVMEAIREELDPNITAQLIERGIREISLKPEMTRKTPVAGI